MSVESPEKQADDYSIIAVDFTSCLEPLKALIVRAFYITHRTGALL